MPRAQQRRCNIATMRGRCCSQSNARQRVGPHFDSRRDFRLTFRMRSWKSFAPGCSSGYRAVEPGDFSREKSDSSLLAPRPARLQQWLSRSTASHRYRATGPSPWPLPRDRCMTTNRRDGPRRPRNQGSGALSARCVACLCGLRFVDCPCMAWFRRPGFPSGALAGCLAFGFHAPTGCIASHSSL